MQVTSCQAGIHGALLTDPLAMLILQMRPVR